MPESLPGRSSTVGHFVGGPWDGRTERLHGCPPTWNVLPPPMPTAVGIKGELIDPEPVSDGRLVYECRERWTWEGEHHARYVVRA